jgi:hypothetical protein
MSRDPKSEGRNRVERTGSSFATGTAAFFSTAPFSAAVVFYVLFQ